VNDDYFLAEFLVVEPPSAVYREYLQFKHFRRPLTNLAEVTAHVAGRVEHNLVAGWEGQHYSNRTNTIPDGGVAQAEYIDLFNPVETQATIDMPLARVAHFTHNTNALYAQDQLTLGARVKAMAGVRFDVFRRSSHNNPVEGGGETDGPILRRRADALTGRAGLVYQPSPSVDLYGSIANSFRPLTQAQPDGTTLQPERGRQLEFGQRLHLAGDRLQVNTALFHIVRKNIAFARPGNFFGLRAQSRMFIDRSNAFSVDGYGLLNLALRYVHGAVEYAVNVNNVTDTEYFASVLYDSQMYPGEPFNVLGTVRIRLR
jgi:iron complex outermembrane recepter protein